MVYLVLMPMAIEDRPLLDMLIAWSSSHLSLCNDIYHVRALGHRSTALKSFASSLSASAQTPEISLAGCLVFCSMSAILGDTAAWHNHLDGAAQIIRSARSNYEPHGLAAISRTYEGRWLLRNFAYHDILMSVTLDREPLIPGQYWISDEKTTIDSYFGLASEPMALLSMISSLNGDMVRHNRQLSFSGSDGSESPTADSDGSHPPMADMDSFSARACRIETDLQNWKCSVSHDPCLISQAEAYRSAALIHLYRVIKRHVPGISVGGKIARQASAIVQHVRNMPLKCLPECTLLFPLFMAGGEITLKADIQFIRERLQHIATYRHFQNAASALSVLKELWLQHTSFTGLVTSEPLDWAEILIKRGWKLALS
jgi:transcriptional activator protein UGA3